VGNPGKKKAFTNHIRFFKNGRLLRSARATRDKPQGEGGSGIAFDRIQHGTYYPAFSCYVGGGGGGRSGNGTTTDDEDGGRIVCEGNFGPVWRHDPNEIMRREYGEDWGERVLGIGSRSENGATSSSGDDGQQQQQQPLIRGFQESRPPVPGTGAAEDAVEEWRRQAEWRFRVMCKGEEEKGRDA